MLPQFRVSLDEAVMVQEDNLRGTVTPIFEKMGVPPEDAQLALGCREPLWLHPQQRLPTPTAWAAPRT